MAFNSVLVGIPSTSQSVKSATALTMANVAKSLVASGRSVDFHNIDSAEIVTARDMFANMVLHSDRWDSLLFIDSDMSFDARLVMRMIALDEQLMGVAYTRRELDLERFALARQETGNSAVAMARASSFTVIPRWRESDQPLEVRDGFASLAGVGMGCALISRDVFTAMIDAKVVKPRTDLSAGPNRICWSFFDNIEHDGVRLGEDYSFCHRWSESMGNKVWVCVDEAPYHIGGFEYSARYSDLFA